MINPIELLSYVRKNIRSVAAQHSQSIKRLKGKKNYGHMLRIIEEKAEKLTFAHVMVLLNLQLGKDLYDIFAHERDELVKMGMISKHGRLRPQGQWITKLVKNFTENVMGMSWQRVWLWVD